MKKKTSKRVTKSKVKSKTKIKSKPKAKVIVIRTSREERPRMRDSVASGFGAGFGVAAGHEVGEWLFNPGRKGKRRNPERFQVGKSYVVIPKSESKYGPFVIDVVDLITDSEGKWVVDNSAEAFQIDNLISKNDIRGPFTAKKAQEVWRDVYYPDLRDMYRMQHEM